MQFDAQDTEYRRANPERFLRRDRGRRSTRRAALRRPTPRRPADRRHRAAAGVPRPRDRRAADRRAAARGGRGGPDRRASTSRCTTARPGSTNGWASWSPRISASTDGWSGRRERRAIRRTPPGSASLLAAGPIGTRNRSRWPRASCVEAGRSPAAAPARAVPRRPARTAAAAVPRVRPRPRGCSRWPPRAPSGSAPHRHRSPRTVSPTRPSKRSKVSHLGSVTRRCYSP